MNGHLRALRRKPLPGAQVKRHALPSPVVDHHFHGDISWSPRVRRDTFFVPVAAVLGADDVRADVRTVNRAQRAEYLHLLVSNVIGGKRRRRLHRTEGEHLKEMVLNDIPQHAGLVVEPAALLDADRLRGVDLTWSMYLRFQIGSKIEFPKRNTRMFWTVSLPR